MPDLKEVVERPEGDASYYRAVVSNPYSEPERYAANHGALAALEHAISLLKPLLDTDND